MFTLPDLPYDYSALEPYISADIMKLHHDKHHQTYVDNLNKALEGHTDLEGKSIEDIMHDLTSIPEEIRTAVKNNGGGHYNHSLFWEMMRPGKDANQPGGELLNVLQGTFGDFESFKKDFSEHATKIFGSGWQWLVWNNGELQLMNTSNQDSPLSQGVTPLLGLDVWEHAYYLQYYNKRADYIEAWWSVVNWDTVALRLEEA